MSTQSYYKDRLGFDPHEALYDGAPSLQSPTSQKSGSRARSVPHHFNNSGSAGNNNGSHYEHNVSRSGKSKLSNNNHSSIINSSGGSNNNLSLNSQGGYEDALTQFKGTMSIWDYFVENWDITGMFWIIGMRYVNDMHTIALGRRKGTAAEATATRINRHGASNIQQNGNVMVICSILLFNAAYLLVIECSFSAPKWREEYSMNITCAGCMNAVCIVSLPSADVYVAF